jgi:hypothetical protein
MPIKYADIIININSEKESLFDYFGRFFGNENSINDNDTIIILFDDQTVCDVKNEYIDKKFTFGPTRLFNSFLPYYFITNDGKRLHFKLPDYVNGLPKINANNIFKNYSKFDTNKKVASFYNFIYYDNTIFSDVFSIIKNGSNEITPRYLLAYDDTYLKRDDIIYLINCIFKNTF